MKTLRTIPATDWGLFLALAAFLAALLLAGLKAR
jgi:hypothetical protein